MSWPPTIEEKSKICYRLLQYLLHPKLLNQKVLWHFKPWASAPSNVGYDYRFHHFSFMYSWILFAPLFGRSLTQTTNLPTILFSFCVHPNDIMWLIVLPTSRLRAENRSQWGQILPSRLPWWVCSENLLQNVQIANIKCLPWWSKNVVWHFMELSWFHGFRKNHKSDYKSDIIGIHS